MRGVRVPRPNQVLWKPYLTLKPAARLRSPPPHVIPQRFDLTVALREWRASLSFWSATSACLVTACARSAFPFGVRSQLASACCLASSSGSTRCVRCGWKVLVSAWFRRGVLFQLGALLRRCPLFFARCSWLAVWAASLALQSRCAPSLPRRRAALFRWCCIGGFWPRMVPSPVLHNPSRSSPPLHSRGVLRVSFASLRVAGTTG